jgi:hypothetical protein
MSDRVTSKSIGGEQVDRGLQGEPVSGLPGRPLVRQVETERMAGRIE